MTNSKTTVIEIHIKGLALCYQQEINSKKIWKVLFPFNDCHKVCFSHISPDGSVTKEVALKGSDHWIKISAANAVSKTGETLRFTDEVFDFTHKDEDYQTHDSIRMLPNWKSQGVIMEIENAVFDVLDTLRPQTNEKIILHGGKTEYEFKNLAHSVKAVIELGDNGVLTMSSNAPMQIPNITGGGIHKLIFNNDCDTIHPGKSDMDMYYDCVFEDPADPAKRFWVGSRAPSLYKSDTPNLAMGKPCLIGKATKSGSLP